MAIEGKWESNFQWNAPYWKDINDKDKTAVGFVKGDALSAAAGGFVDDFINELKGGLNLWTGPIELQDGSVYLAGGVVGSDQQVWYLPQLLKGMEGQSVSE